MVELPPRLVNVWSDFVPLLCRCIELHVSAVGTEPEWGCRIPVSLSDDKMGFEGRVLGISITLLWKAMRIKDLPVNSDVFSDIFLASVLGLIEDHPRALAREGDKLREVIMNVNSSSLKKRSIDDWLAADDKSDLRVALAVVRRESACRGLLATTVDSLIAERKSYATFAQTLAVEFLFALLLIEGLSHSLLEEQKMELADAFRTMVFRSPFTDRAIRQMTFVVFRSILVQLKGLFSSWTFREANLELLLGISDLSDQEVGVHFQKIRSDIRAECMSSDVGVQSSFPEGSFTFIPPEILSIVFTLACPSLFKDHSARRQVLWLASVCRRWRKVCLTTPPLWCAIVLQPRKCSSFHSIIPGPPIVDTYPLLEGWLDRARGVPKKVMLEALNCHCYETHHLASIPPIFGMLLSRGPTLEHLTFNVNSVIAFNSFIGSLPLPDDTSPNRPWDTLKSLVLCFNYQQESAGAEEIHALDVALQTLPMVERLELILPPLPTAAVIGTPLKLANDHMRVLTELTLQSSWMGVSLLDIIGHLAIIRRLSLDFDYTYELRHRVDDPTLVRLRAAPLKLKYLQSLTISNSDADLLRYITTPTLTTLNLDLDMGIEDGIAFPSLLSLYIRRSHIQRSLVSMMLSGACTIPFLLGAALSILPSLKHLTISNPFFIGSSPLFIDFHAPGSPSLLPGLETLVLANFPASYDVSFDHSCLLSTERHRIFGLSLTYARDP
ncbi:hypothetical protein DFP72DRAFT_1077896 [Ephemerocybe angulata]|uniref:F-box domain-containing protein n=1 Tax=Ephemerocybe angulata TaxID=980116 RepID=A0A8H6HEY5_9AGAR|nr:hypothetical protein DFP72DRAFT_1077896 [Tulosesus angulatus]